MKERSMQNKNVVSAIAVAGVMSLGFTPAWGQQSGRSDPQEQQQRSAQGLISTEALKGSRVMDQQNREIGELSNIFIDPKTGRIARADIEFDTRVAGTGETYSVSWDDLSIKRQGNEVVVALDQSVVQRVQQAKQGRQGEKAQTQQRDQSQTQRGTYGSAAETDRQRIPADRLSTQQIRKVQQELNKQGFHAGSVDGQWSSQTQTAIRNFQESKGLQATGQLDQSTLNELGLDADEFREQGRSESKTDPNQRSR